MPISKMPKKSLPPLKTDKHDGHGNLVAVEWHFDADSFQKIRLMTKAYVTAWSVELLAQWNGDIEVVSIGNMAVLGLTAEAFAAREAIMATEKAVQKAIDKTRTVEELAAVNWSAPMAVHDVSTEPLEFPK